MNSCREFSEKLILFEDLSSEEQSEIKQHMKNCDHCRTQLQQYQLITAELQTMQPRNHLSEDLLVRYCLYRSDPTVSDYDNRKMTESELREIAKHTTECDRCRNRVEAFSAEYREIEKYLAASGLPDLKLNANPIGFLIRTKISKFLMSARHIFTQSVDSLKKGLFAPLPSFYPMAAGGAAILLAVIWFGPFFRGDNPYLSLTSIDPENVSSLTRGGMPAPLSAGLSAFRSGNYQEAIQNFDRFIANNRVHSLLYYGHYLLGISYLAEADLDFLDRFHKIDRTMVEKGIQHLQTAQTLSNNSGVGEECDWYLAKGYLLLQDGAKAKELLEKIRDLRGRKYKEAQKMLADLYTLLH